MTRRDRITLTWLLPLAVLLTLWAMFRATPCLDSALGNQWSQWFPPPPLPAAGEPEMHDGLPIVRVENPYGIVACDHFREAGDHVVSGAIFLLLNLFIGYLAARRFDQRPIQRAGLIAALSLTLVVCLAMLAFLPAHLRLADDFGRRILYLELTVNGAVITCGVLLAMFAAWLTLRIRPRVVTNL